MAALLGGITKVWNAFKAVEELVTPGAPTRPSVNVDFQAEEGTPPYERVVLSQGPGHSNASHYFIDPGEDLVALSADEFGHHFGLQDEYQQTAADHQRQTGQAAPVGDAVADGTPPGQIAREIGSALRTAPRADHGTNTLAVIQGHSLTQGRSPNGWRRATGTSSGTSVIADCNRLIDVSPAEGAMSKQRLCTQPFLYMAENLMGGAETQGNKHAHTVEPRHVRHIVALVERAMGGIWNPARR